MSVNVNDAKPIVYDVDNGYHKFTSDELATMETLKERMKDIKNIRFQTDNMFLAKYLRVYNWDVEKSLDHMQRVYRMRKEYPIWFATKSISDYMGLLRQKHRYILNGRDKNGRRIFVYKLSNVRPETRITDMAQLDDICYECMLMEHQTQLHGVVVIIDCSNIPWSMLKWCHPSLVRIGAEKSDLCPLKHLEIHYVNQSTMLNTVSQLVRPFLSKKLLAKFHFHKKGFEQLKQQLGYECLPEEYGGPIGATVDHEFGYKFLLKYEDFLLHNRQHGIIS